MKQSVVTIEVQALPELSWRLLRVRRITLGWLVTATIEGLISETFLPVRQVGESPAVWAAKLETLLVADAYEPVRFFDARGAASSEPLVS